MDIIGIIMSAGRTSVDVALYTLIPVMVVMLIIMRYLEQKGVLDAIVRVMTPIFRPFGITGLAIFALIQLNFVSFAAPLAALAMLFAMGQGNVFYPLIPFGLHWGEALTISIVGGLAAAAFTYHLSGRRLSTDSLPLAEKERLEGNAPQGLIAVINGAGSDAIRLALGSVPMLLLSLTVVGILKAAGAIEGLTALLAPLLGMFNIPDIFVMPALTKMLAGGTAYYGVMTELIQKGLITPQQINASAGLMIQTFDLPGIGIFLGIASRFVRLFRYVIPGVLLGILLRTVIHLLLNH